MLMALLIGWLILGHGGGEPWFFGGRTPHEMRAEVTKVVADKDMANTTNYNLSLVEKEYKSLESQRSSLEKEILAALERHDTPPEEFHAIEKRADEINASATKKILDVRFVMREQLSDAPMAHPFSTAGGALSQIAKTLTPARLESAYEDEYR